MLTSAIYIFVYVYIFITTIRRDVYLQTMSHSLPRQHSTLQPSNVYAQKAIVPSNRTTRCIMQLIHEIMHIPQTSPEPQCCIYSFDHSIRQRCICNWEHCQLSHQWEKLSPRKVTLLLMTRVTFLLAPPVCIDFKLNIELKILRYSHITYIITLKATCNSC